MARYRPAETGLHCIHIRLEYQNFSESVHGTFQQNEGEGIAVQVGLQKTQSRSMLQITLFTTGFATFECAH